MIDQVSSPDPDQMNVRLKKRYAAERRFRTYGILAVMTALLFLVLLLGTVVSRGWSAFWQTDILLPVTLAADSAAGEPDYQAILNDSLQAMFPDAGESREGRRRLRHLPSTGAVDVLREKLLSGQSHEVLIPASAAIDQWNKGNVPRTIDEGSQFSEQELVWLEQLKKDGRLVRRFNRKFFVTGDSRQPEMAGLGGAIMGSFYSLLVTIILSFPLGVAAAVYLEEFARKNRWTDLIEININNLAAVPSIVFGLLGLEIFLNAFGMARSSPLVGGLCLTLLSLPTVIIASRVALKAVPPWIREAATGLGASPLQVVGHHVLPLAMPGILTGSIIGMARAIGESAPLLMVGMVAFIVDVPKTPFDSSTVLPVQIYLWANSPERAFVERTSAAIMVLLLFLAVMNAGAIYLRKKFERRW